MGIYDPPSEPPVDSRYEARGATIPGYEVTRDGRVFSLKNWNGQGRRELKPANADGYLRVCLTINGIRKSRLVHQLVAAEFLPPKPTPRHEIRHLDGNRQNNRDTNLAWGTQQENADDRERHGRTSRGAAHSAANKRGRRSPLYRLTGNDAVEIRLAYQSGREDMKSLALRFNVGLQTISDLIHGKTHSTVGGPIISDDLRHAGEKDPRTGRFVRSGL